jgi:hypothetical protein
MLKYLRIAVTAVSLTACLVLVALWLRSYWYLDRIDGSIGKPWIIFFTSKQGEFSCEWNDHDEPFGPSWGFMTKPVEEDWDRHPLSYGGGYLNLESDSLLIVVPYWAALLMATTLTLFPWIRVRFSLRTLLIATALVAVGLGVIAYVARSRNNINDDGPITSLPSPFEWEAMTE